MRSLTMTPEMSSVPLHRKTMGTCWVYVVATRSKYSVLFCVRKSAYLRQSHQPQFDAVLQSTHTGTVKSKSQSSLIQLGVCAHPSKRLQVALNFLYTFKMKEKIGILKTPFSCLSQMGTNVSVWSSPCTLFVYTSTRLSFVWIHPTWIWWNPVCA